MIKQMVRLAKQKSDDGLYETAAPVGTEFWINPVTVSMRKFAVRGTTKDHTMLVVMIVDQEVTAYFPVELLSFTNTFKVEGV